MAMSMFWRVPARLISAATSDTTDAGNILSNSIGWPQLHAAGFCQHDLIVQIEAAHQND